MAPETKMKDYGHPAMFPEELVERCLKLFSYKGDVVLDLSMEQALLPMLRINLAENTLALT